MNYKIPGLASIGLAFLAIGIADYQLFKYSTIFGVIYIVGMLPVFLNTLYQYCRKCPHVGNSTCRHVIFGKLIKRLFGLLEPSPYETKAMLSVLISNSLFFIFPQYWLFQNTFLVVTFWVIMSLSVVIIRKSVCPSCLNNNCYFAVRKGEQYAHIESKTT